MEITNWINSRDCRELARLVPGFITLPDGSIFIKDRTKEGANIRVTEKTFYHFESQMRGGYIQLASLIAREHKEPVCIQISDWYFKSLDAINVADYKEYLTLRNNVSQLMGYID
jgi:hypothetical protein